MELLSPEAPHCPGSRPAEGGPLLRVRGQVFRGRPTGGRTEGQIKGQGDPQVVVILIGRHGMVGRRREQNQQSSPRGQVEMGRIPADRTVEGPAMAHGQTRHQFIALASGVKPQATTAARAITVEINDGAQVRIGMVVPPDRLPGFTDDGLGPLDV